MLLFPIDLKDYCIKYHSNKIIANTNGSQLHKKNLASFAIVPGIPDSWGASKKVANEKCLFLNGKRQVCAKLVANMHLRFIFIS
jgi:hypothetical protein